MSMARLVVESSLPKVQQWLDNTARDQMLQYVDRQLYWFAYTESSSADQETRPGWNGMAFWLQQLNTQLGQLKSKTLQTTLRCVESGPLVCILSDCLHHVDEFFVKSEGSGGDDTESRFLQALEMYCLLKHRLQSMMHTWPAVVNAATPAMYRGFVEAHRFHLIATMKSLVQTCYLAVHSCYTANAKPRYLQLCDKLDLSLKEQEALHYIFMQNAGTLFAKLYNTIVAGERDTSVTGSRSTSMALAAASFAEMSGKELYEFFSDNRAHLQQELITPEDEFSSLLTASFLKIPSVVLKACCGCQLTADELYKVDSTALAEILSVHVSDGPLAENSSNEDEGELECLVVSEHMNTGPTNETTTESSTGPATETSTGPATETSTGPATETSTGPATETSTGPATETSTGPATETSTGPATETSTGPATETSTGPATETSTGPATETSTGPATETSTGPATETSTGPATETSSSTQSSPYTTDLEYLEDNFELIEVLVKARKTETSDDMLLLRADQRKPEAVLREMKAKARSLRAKVVQRMEATRKAVDKWLPRLERLAELKQLDVFERNVLLTLTGCMVSRNLRDTERGDSIFKHQINIGMLIGLFCDGLEEQIKARVYFYRNSQLVKEGLIHVSDPPLLSRGNFLDSAVELDRRLLDYIVGLDTELNELVDGSDLYTPDTLLSEVALPANQQQLLLNTFDSFYKFQKTCKDLQLNTRGYSNGLCLLFYGPSGTGKTMTANAVANFLGKKVLLLTVSLLAERELTKELLQFLFREAKIHNAIVFFDECEALFETRENRSNVSLALMLTEIEQNDGLIILATNRHQDLDEAMHRRIQLSLPFSIPDHTLRAEIWRSHVPDQLIEGEVDWMNLAQSYELTGGLIRNAVLSAVSLSSSKNDSDKVRLTNKDLYAGAKLQLRGLLEMIDFERRVVPTFGLDGVVVDHETESQLQAVLTTAKTHKFISSQWGFTASRGNVASAAGVVVVMSAPARAGKTTVGLALAYELGQPVKEANCSELLSHTVNSNPRASRGIAAFFRDAHTANAVVVLDNAELVLGSASGLFSGVVGCETYSLAYQVERYPGLVILNTRHSVSLLDLSRLPQLRYVLTLKLPDTHLREKLWRKLLPETAPVSTDIDFAALADRYALYGGQIATAICSAAEHTASSLAGSQQQQLTAQLLKTAAEEQLSLSSVNKTLTQTMYQ